ncbi:DUF4097 family beta strand repeat-containing protein [Halalkalibacterium ligniniphilum]|uniref:DUF4097 family beta strand repeat-containing protein n=1 Tax=Halalkalibacterium ligniniphilum TaxID=1134413 RepID=UPI0003449038|nr:DUF4097 domain-containing protein [Halalkalibacterium ligniniphilum]
MEERKMILKMIEDGKITAEEGVKLLSAMEKPSEPTKEATEGNKVETERSLSTEVNWDEGEKERKRSRERDRERNRYGFDPTKLTGFFESAIQKIKDFDLDFNFGPHVVVDHVFQHRDLSPKSMDVSLENGSVNILPWDEPDVRIECKAKVYRVKNTDEARSLFLQEALFRVNERKVLFQTKVKSIKVDATIYVPRTAFDSIKLYTFNGSLKGDSLNVDTLDVNTLNGGIIFEGIKAKKVLAETVNGEIELQQGDVDICDAKTVNGSITITGQVQDVDAETVNGSITYEIDRLSESGYADFKAMTGSIHLVVSKSLRVEGKLKTNVGSYTCDLTSFEVLEEKKDFAQKTMSFVGNQDQSPRVKIVALTNTGSIRVKDRS